MLLPRCFAAMFAASCHAQPSMPRLPLTLPTACQRILKRHGVAAIRRHADAAATLPTPALPAAIRAASAAAGSSSAAVVCCRCLSRASCRYLPSISISTASAFRRAAFALDIAAAAWQRADAARFQQLYARFSATRQPSTPRHAATPPLLLLMPAPPPPSRAACRFRFTPATRQQLARSRPCFHMLLARQLRAWRHGALRALLYLCAMSFMPRFKGCRVCRAACLSRRRHAAMFAAAIDAAAAAHPMPPADAALRALLMRARAPRVARQFRAAAAALMPPLML